MVTGVNDGVAVPPLLSPPPPQPATLREPASEKSKSSLEWEDTVYRPVWICGTHGAGRRVCYNSPSHCRPLDRRAVIRGVTVFTAPMRPASWEVILEVVFTSTSARCMHAHLYINTLEPIVSGSQNLSNSSKDTNLL